MGKTPVYLADFLIKVDAGSKLNEDEGYGVQGFMNKVTIIKSRNNRAGQEFELVFDQNRGFDNILSNLNLLKAEKRIGGAGRSFCIASLPEIKFSQKEFKNKLRKEEDLRTEYIINMKEVLETYIFDSLNDEKNYSDLNEELDLDSVEIEVEEVEEEPKKKKK